jgi:FkbM family methyltransferase
LKLLINEVWHNSNFLGVITVKAIWLQKVKKLIKCLSVNVWRAPLKHGVAAAIEHDLFFRSYSFDTVVDIGANKGQFSLVMRKNFPTATILAFEPLKQPFLTYSKIFESDRRVKIFNSAIAPNTGVVQINVSKSYDSSSLLEISDLQNEIFPGTSAIGSENITTGPLDSFISKEQIKGVSLLKLDVQGFELEALRASNALLGLFDMVYCECSFIELYTGQALAHEIIEFMVREGFALKGFNNVAYAEDGSTIQADFIFCRGKK